MKRIVSLVAATALLSTGAAALSSPALAAPRTAKAPGAVAKKVGPTVKWAAPLTAVEEGGLSTGRAQVVETRSRRLPVYSLSVTGVGLDALTCHEVATSSDGVTYAVVGQATSTDTGSLAVGARVASPAPLHVVVAECGSGAVLVGGPLVLR